MSQYFYICAVRVLYLFILIVGSAISVQAQHFPADTLELDEIEVVATRIQQSLELQPTNVEVIDSSRLGFLQGQNIGQVLASESSLFIKDNGPGGMATASQRGLSPGQVQVLWEGISINDAMLGLTDLSLLPASLFSGIQLSSGMPSTAFGGGSLSGALYLSSDFNGENQLSVGQGAGSFGRWQTSLNGQYKTGDWQVSVRSTLENAENDYPYYNDAYNREQYRDHNRTERRNIMTSVGHKLGKSRIKSTIWLADSDNQIPGKILTTNSRARQEDQAIRWLSSFSSTLGEAKIGIKNYLDRTKLNYFDPKTDVRSLSTTRRWMLSSDMSLPLSAKVLLKGEISGSLTGVATNNYASDKVRRQFSVLSNPEIALFNQRFRLYPALRLDAYNDFGTVLSPSLGLNYVLKPDFLYLRGQLSRDFNPPTFNALYWGQGGNPDLQAERSNSAEAGFTVRPNAASFSSLKLTAFLSRVENGIRWNQGQESSDFFMPSNVDQITTKGLEAALTNTFTLLGDWQFQFQQSGRLTRSEISEPRFRGDAAVGRQLRYVPQWQYHARLRLQKGIASGLLQYRWTGRRFYTATENIDSSLDPYQVLNASLQIQKHFFGLYITAQGGVRNLLNTDYQIIRWYAMPQRNYHFSLTATYQF